MKLQLAVNSKTFMEIFLSDYDDPDRRERNRRIHKHQLLLNAQFVELLRKKAYENNFGQQFDSWFVNAMQSAEKVQNVGESAEQEELPLLIDLVNLSDSTNFKIVVYDTDRLIRNQNPNIRFCDIETFGKPADKIINMNQVLEINKVGGASQHIFSLFELPISLPITENQDAQLLAKYLSKFYDDEITIQDLYFVNNENNFKTYILPYIPRGCELTINICISDEVNHKSRLEREYGATVNCYAKKSLHEGFIITKHYKINLGYRFALFGKNGRTRQDNISIFERE